MKIKKGLCILMSAGLVLSMSMPCAADEVTAESLIEGCIQKNEEYTSVAGKENMTLSMNMSMFGESMSMKMDMALDMESTNDLSHVYGDMTMVSEGMSEEDGEETMKTEIYTQLEDDGSYTVYTLDSETGTWSKTSMDKPQFNMDMKNLIIGDSFELSEGTVDVDGTACYEVVGKASLSEMMEYIGSSMEGLGEIFPVDEGDADSYTLDICYYFDTETGDLISFKMDGASMLGTLFQDMLAKSFAEMDTGESSEDEELDMSALLEMFQIEIPAFYVEVNDIVYDTVDAIEIPAEALAAAEAA